MTTLPAHTWHVRITLRDGSQSSFTVYPSKKPQRDEIVETGDIGRTVRAKITSYTKEAPREGAVGLGEWQIEATEEL
jgi:hypothetical protein